MEAISLLKARHFRTMLRVLAHGLHLREAHELLRHRAATSKELLADDVNTVLSSCLLSDVPRAIQLYVAQLKATGRLVDFRAPGGATRVVAEFGDLLRAWDLGPHPDLERARYMRSPEVHAERADARAAANRKRPRAEGSELQGEAAEGGEATEAAGAGVGAGAAAAAAAASALDPAEESRLYKEVAAALHATYAPSIPANDGGVSTINANFRVSDELEWRRARFAHASSMFSSLASGALRVTPSARSYVLMLHGALAAGDTAEGKRLFDALVGEAVTDAPAASAPGSGDGCGSSPSPHPPPVCPMADLYSVMQPSMLHALARVGIIPPSALADVLTAPRDTPKWFFLRAASEATKGDQFGSKHGVVITKDGVLVSAGHNHRFGVIGDPHLRVMHSEVHALVRLPSLEAAYGTDVWIVELDGAGVGYEEAIACAMCNKGLHSLGVRAQHYSSHTGVRTQVLTHRPGLVCESLDAAVRREYPEGTCDPGPLDLAALLDDAPAIADPGRGKGSRQAVVALEASSTSPQGAA